jgi:hypothetical protein
MSKYSDNLLSENKTLKDVYKKTNLGKAKSNVKTLTKNKKKHYMIWSIIGNEWTEVTKKEYDDQFIESRHKKIIYKDKNSLDYGRGFNKYGFRDKW